MYTQDDLHLINALDHISKRPDMYVPMIDGALDPAGAFLGRLVCDILLDRRRTVQVLRLDDWWVVASDDDWISAGDNSRKIDAFSSFVPFPEMGLNAIRTEILLAAFGKDVVTFKGVREDVIKGASDDRLLKLVEQHPDWRRCVAFRFE